MYFVRTSKSNYKKHSTSNLLLLHVTSTSNLLTSLFLFHTISLFNEKQSIHEAVELELEFKVYSLLLALALSFILL